MRTRRAATEPVDDAALFREAVSDAVPLAAKPRVQTSPRRAPPVAVQSLLDDHAAFREMLEQPLVSDVAIEAADEAAFVRDGVSPQVLKKLRRGHWVLQAELDLHGARRDEAQAMLGEFLRHALRRGYRSVRVIHGKGLGSKGRQPVLKSMVKVWLAQRDDVLAFCHAPDVHGGTGALLVLLKASP